MSNQPDALRLADLIEWTTVQQDLTEAAIAKATKEQA
jgi:hypothetical protein